MATRPKAVIESRNGEKFSPITITKNVLTDDGQNLHDILSNRKEDMMTPTIENSSSMFKVGQGDNVDYSENVVDGAYESCVFKGKSLVNLVEKPTSANVGNGGKWNGYGGGSPSKTFITNGIRLANTQHGSIVLDYFDLSLFKPNTKYTLFIDVYHNGKGNPPVLDKIAGTGQYAIPLKNGHNCIVFTTIPDLTSANMGIRFGYAGSTSESCVYEFSNIVIVEGDHSSINPDYFEGICDCKSPILSNVGKNLFNFSDSTMKSSWWIMVENGITNVKKEDLSTNYSAIIPAQSNTKYKVSGNNFTRAFYAFLDKDYNVLYADELVQRTTKSLSPQGTAYALFYLNHEDIEKVTNLQIEEGSTATPYEPYKSNTTTFEQKDGKTIVLRSLPNGVCDTLNVETGEYVQRIGEIVFDGEFNLWAQNCEDVQYYRVGTGTINNFKLNSCIINDKLPVAKKVTADTKGEFVGDHTNSQSIHIRLLSSKLSQRSVDGVQEYLRANPITVQYELEIPITTKVDVQGFPHAYENGHVILSSGSIEQSLTPKVEYSVATNRNGQIRSNQKMVERHQKQLDHLQAIILTNLVNTQYEQTLTNLKYDLKNVREEVK